MSTPRALPALEYLTECFNYNPDTGALTWKHRPLNHFNNKHGWNRFNADMPGTEAGNKRYTKEGAPQGIRLRVCVNGVSNHIYAHNIIFQLMGMAIPEGFEVDHRDRNSFNNTWSNLRLATRSQNTANRCRHGKKSYAFPKGVFFRHGRFVAQIQFNNHHQYIGSFATAELAHAAYCSKAAELHGEFARFN